MYARTAHILSPDAVEIAEQLRHSLRRRHITTGPIAVVLRFSIEEPFPIIWTVTSVLNTLTVPLPEILFGMKRMEGRPSRKGLVKISD